MPSRFSPTLQKALGSQSGPAARAFGESAAEARAVSAPASQLYSRNLNQADGPPETLPRLPGKGGKLQVPLYSDLKRHPMGTNLAESFAQSTDGDPEVVSQIPGNVFLTRPLWGVADTGPWLHDGRALTLREAIVMHRGDGSEANSSIDKYENVLSESERYALRVFLSSLRLPVVH
jgi:hypothetical protein